MKSASEQLSEMSRVCSAVVLIERVSESSGTLVAHTAEPGTPILSEVHTAGCWCPSDLEVQGTTRTDKHMLLAYRKAWQMSGGRGSHAAPS